MNAVKIKLPIDEIKEIKVFKVDTQEHNTKKKMTKYIDDILKTFEIPTGSMMCLQYCGNDLRNNMMTLTIEIKKQ